MTKESGVFDDLLTENRSFPPSEKFRANAYVSDSTLHEAGKQDPVAYWEEQAKGIHWMQPWTETLRWDPPHVQWFLGGTLNLAYNCLDRHLDGPRANKAAIIWEGETGETRTLTYRQLHQEVCQAANVMKALGVGRGDRVAIYMPMVVEAAVVMLACARIGAIHSVVFGGFSAESLSDRINDSQCKLLITADGGWRRGSVLALKSVADEALKSTRSIENVLVLRRQEHQPFECSMTPGRDHWYHELVPQASTECPAEVMESEDTLFILYTSGTTGKPKGIVHTTGGYAVGTHATSQMVFDLKEDDV